MMWKTVEFYCRYCKFHTIMEVSHPAENLQIYWLKCTRCNKKWRVPIEVFETCAKKVNWVHGIKK